MSTLSLRLPVSLHRKLSDLAESEGVSLNQLIRLGCRGEGGRVDDPRIPARSSEPRVARQVRRRTGEDSEGSPRLPVPKIPPAYSQALTQEGRANPALTMGAARPRVNARPLGRPGSTYLTLEKGTPCELRIPSRELVKGTPGVDVATSKRRGAEHRSSVSSLFSRFSQSWSRDSDDAARGWVTKITELMDTSGVQDPEGRDARVVKAEGLSVDEKFELSRVVDELAHWFERRYWEESR